MKTTIRIATLVVATLFVVSCGSLGAKTFREINVDSGKGYAVDATTRLIVVTNKGGKDNNKFVVCAEPSPDALVASLGADAALKATFPPQAGGAGFDASGKITQTAKSIAIRTATVQLMRDGLFRACEGLINGVVDKNEYKIIIFGIDDLMAVLHGIDALGSLKDGGSEAAKAIKEIVITKLKMTAAAMAKR